MIYPKFRIIMLGLAIFIVLASLWFLSCKKTKMGITIRAGVDNFEMVSALGVNVRRLFTVVFCLSGFLAGVAGVVGGTGTMLVVGEDWRILTLTLIVIIIGGMGSLGGTIVGALITGDGLQFRHRVYLGVLPVRPLPAGGHHSLHPAPGPVRGQGLKRHEDSPGPQKTASAW